MNQKRGERQQVHCQQLQRRTNPRLGPSGENQCEMEQQGWCQNVRHNFRPVYFPVKDVEFFTIVERPADEGNQTKDVKVHGPRGVPPADENEQPDEQIEQTHDPLVILDREWLFLRRRNKRRLEFLTTARELVTHLSPEPRTIQALSNLGGSRNRCATEGQQEVACANPGASGRGIGGDLTGLDSLIRL